MDYGKEKCQMIESWTFSGLVGSFLDLTIAYLLLCVSATAYLASRFLGFFGLCLPCPCNGLFGNPKPYNCLQGSMVDYPSESSSAIQFSARSKLPFDSMSMEEQTSKFNLKSFRDGSQKNVQAELEGEASYSSATERMERHSVCRYSIPKNEMDAEFCASNLTKRRDDSKGKGITSLRGRSALRRRRRRRTVDYGIFSSSDASYDRLQLDKAEGSSEPLNYADGSEARKGNGLQECFLHDSESSGAAHENKSAENDVFTAEEFMYNELEQDVGNDANMIRGLEEALEEEHAVRTALYNELEKERSAAATAADEAMNMILRLQEEKAAVEIEARQYHRIIEAKSTFDAEEMNILKEILLRREHERHFLEKELEAYRKMFTGTEQSDEDTFNYLDMEGERALYLNEDPMLMLKGISNAFDEKDEDKMKSTSSSTDYGVTFIEPKEHTSLSGFDEVVGCSIPRPISMSGSGHIDISDHVEFQDKGMVFMEADNPLTQQNEGNEEPCVHVVGDESTSSDLSACVDDSLPYIPKKRLRSEHDTSIHSSEEPSSGKAPLFGLRRSSMSALELKSYNEAGWVREPRNDNAQLRKFGSEEGVSTDLTSALSPSRGKTSNLGLRRRSMSALDNERLKLEGEVGWLREKLKMVQKGKKKLNISVELKDQERVQFKLLDDIESQLQEIRQLSGHAREAILPPRPSSSKVKSKKRRSSQGPGSS